MVIRYPVACYASNCAITINCYLKVTGTIVIAVYQTGDVACAVTAASNRCITIGAYYVVQAYIKCSLLDRDNACSVIYKLIVTKLIAYQLRTCYNHVLFVFACVRSVAPALISRILSVSFIAYACAVLQAYLIAVDDAVLL